MSSVGRPKVPPKKQRVIAMKGYFSEAEEQEVRMLAARERICVSTLIRRRVLGLDAQSVPMIGSKTL